MKIQTSILVGFIFSICLPAASQTNLSWKLTNEFPGGAKTGIAKCGDSVIVVSLKNGVIRSSDLGNSFQNTLTSRETYCIFTDSEGQIYVGGNGCIYLSKDGGQAWDSVFLATNLPIKQIVEHVGTGIFAISNTLNENLEYVGDGVFFSADKGKSWEKRQDGLNSFTICEGIACDRQGRLYLAVADEEKVGKGGLYVSDNAGNSWNHVPIKIDGKGVINNNPIVQFTHGLSISGHDTVYFSFEGSSGGLVGLNLKIAANDLKANENWQICEVDKDLYWYLNRPLRNQFFASNNAVFSSTIGALSLGKSYIKPANGGDWKNFDSGLGLGEFGLRTPQHFIELNNIVYMVQEYDERIYWMSLEDGIVSVPKAKMEECVFGPNPVKQGGALYFSKDILSEWASVAIYSLTGQKILQIENLNSGNFIQAPNQSGVFIIKIQFPDHIQTSQFVVYE